MTEPLRVVIVGAGFGGIAAAIELRRHGFDRLTILEAAADLGGTWYYNSYPGAACDVPSHGYSFSYAQRTDWSRLCSPRDEILNYLREVGRDHGVERHLVRNATVTACEWDDRSRTWTVRARLGADPATAAEVEYRAEAIVLATGQLNQPALPRIEALDSFAGHSFHSARWDHDYDLRGRRVAVIGTGASAVQFVPEMAGQVARLTVFQRTGNWFMPRRNRTYPARFRQLVRRVPWLQRARRALLFLRLELFTSAIRNPETVGMLGRAQSMVFMRWQLRDAQVRRKAWPDYTFGCKRILFSSAFLPTLQRDNVELVTDPIVRMTPEGPVTSDGRVHPVDCVIYGTGFKTNDFMFPMEITGRDGRTLREQWAKHGPHAHLGITVPGFPSMFLVYGPNTNTSGGSIVFFLERQVRYLRQALQRVRAAGAAAIEVRAEVARRSDRRVQAGFTGTAWTRCDSWYRDGSGRIVANWPRYMRDYAQVTRRPDPREFVLLARPVSPAVEPAERTG